MKKTHAIRWRLSMTIALAALATTAGIGLCRIEPSGKKAGVIQFDAISEIYLDLTRGGNVVVFARYWACEDYYAVSVIWTEPHGGGVNMKTAVVLSDETGFRMDNEQFADNLPTNITYAKPIGERGPFCDGGGFYGGHDMRFAEAEAVARRVYVTDLESTTALKSGDIDVNVPRGPGGAARRLARLKVHAQADRIESMELFDNEQRSLAKMRYEYERSAGPARIATLVAELPVRPETIGQDQTMMVTGSDGNRTPRTIPGASYISHKGGRTCTVTYRDVTAGDKVLRLPVQIEVQRTDDKRVVRSARLMNFKRVDLDKDGVWQAAKAFSGSDSEHATYARLVGKFLEHEAKLGPPPVDGNDPAVIQRLIAKYPFWEEPLLPAPNWSRSEHPTDPENVETTRAEWQKETEARKQRQAKEQERIRKWREEVARMPRPPKKEVEPNDVRLIRQLNGYYGKRFATIDGPVPESEWEIWDLSQKLPEILRYHRAARLPEDRPPEPNDLDFKRIRELKGHYERLTTQQDHGLGGRLRALDALTRLDQMVRDYDAFERHATCYLQVLREARLNQMYLAGGHNYIVRLIRAGRYEKADKLFRQWIEQSAVANDVDGVFRFCGMGGGGRANPWAAVQLLDRFLKKPGLSPLERYEALALRALRLDMTDKLLADPDPEDESRKTLIQWTLRSTTRAEIANRVEPAIVQAASAWEALGSARYSEAKPYTTDSMPYQARNALEAPDPTRTQQTSAELDLLVRQRTMQPRGTPRPSETARPRPRTPRR